MMRTFKIASWAMLSVAIAGCSIGEPASRSAPLQPDSYYESQAQADADLARFESDNPGCALWTNWQKACANTGPGNSTQCISDSDRKVAPSKPFCADSGSFVGADLADGVAASKARFCDDLRLSSATDAQGKRTRVYVCDRFRPDRPFNGQKVKDMVGSQLCKSWRRGVEGVLYCSKWADQTCGPRDAQAQSRAAVENSLKFTGDISIPEQPRVQMDPIIGVQCTISPVSGDEAGRSAVG